MPLQSKQLESITGTQIIKTSILSKEGLKSQTIGINYMRPIYEFSYSVDIGEYVRPMSTFIFSE